jgi:hypothetical protein
MAVSGILCVIGMWRLRCALGWDRRSWRGRALGLFVLPFFILPAWISTRMLDRPFDPNINLHQRNIPGYRLALPDWPVTSESADYWVGSVTMRRRVTADKVIVTWSPGKDPAAARATEKAFFGGMADFVALDDEAGIVVGQPARTYYYRSHGWTAARTTWACPDDRLGVVTTIVESPREVVRAFHLRLLASISCVATTPPAAVYAALRPPDGFKLESRDPTALSYGSTSEMILVSAGVRDTAMKNVLHEDKGRRVFVESLAPTLKIKPAGDMEQTLRNGSEGSRAFWIQPVALEDQQRGWLTLTTWHCPELSTWFWAFHLGRGESNKTQGIDRLLAASCPEKT